jgi:quinol monooxygenase YgiN
MPATSWDSPFFEKLHKDPIWEKRGVIMDKGFYTLARWKVKPGMEERFIEAWKAMGEAFLNLPRPATQGTLIQSVSDPTVFYSFGPWDDIDEIDAMRADPVTREAMQQVTDLCEEATPGTYQVVAEMKS